MDADWHAFCQAIYEGIEGKDWEEVYFHYREMSKAAGAKKPSESQKAKLAARDREEEFMIRLARTTFFEAIRLGWSCGKSTSKTNCGTGQRPIVALDKALKCVENPHQG